MRKGREVLHIAWRREELQSECLFCVVLFSLEHLYEGFVVELSLLNGCFFPRLFDLVVGEVVTTSLQKLLQVFLGDGALSFLVKLKEGLHDGLLRVRATELLAEQVKEHGEVDGSGGLLDHLLQLLIWGDTTEAGVHFFEVLNTDDTITVGVDHLEGLLHLLHGLLWELG